MLSTCISIMALLLRVHMNVIILFLNRPGGELRQNEDQVEGLKRLLTEVSLKFFLLNSIHSALLFPLTGNSYPSMMMNRLKFFSQRCLILASPVS